MPALINEPQKIEEHLICFCAAVHAKGPPTVYQQYCLYLDNRCKICRAKMQDRNLYKCVFSARPGKYKSTCVCGWNPQYFWWQRHLSRQNKEKLGFYPSKHKALYSASAKRKNMQITTLHTKTESMLQKRTALQNPGCIYCTQALLNASTLLRLFHLSLSLWKRWSYSPDIL